MLSKTRTAKSLEASLRTPAPKASSQRQMKNFVALKEKIIRTDELIKLYRARVSEGDELRRQASASQGRLASLEQAVKGLKSELQATYEENSSLKEGLLKASRELEEERRGRVVQELLSQQLSAQVEQLQCDKEGGASTLFDLRKEVYICREEKEKWIKKHQKLQKEKEQLAQSVCCTCSPLKRQRQTRKRQQSTSTSSSSDEISPTIAPPTIAPPPSSSSSSSSSSLEAVLAAKIGDKLSSGVLLHSETLAVPTAGGCKVEPIAADQSSLSMESIFTSSLIDCETDLEIQQPISDCLPTPSAVVSGLSLLVGGVKKEPVSPGIPSILTPPPSSTFNPAPSSSSSSSLPLLPLVVSADLKNDLFGEDSDDGDDLCVSDSDSTGSESSLDDLADLLTGLTPNKEEETEISSVDETPDLANILGIADSLIAPADSPIETCTATAALVECRSPASVSVQRSSPEIAKLSVSQEIHAVGESLDCGRLEAMALREEETNIEAGECCLDVPAATVPRITIEVQDDLTCSSSDDEMEVSDLDFDRLFSFGNNFLSPLPPSPLPVPPGTDHLPPQPPPSPPHSPHPSHPHPSQMSAENSSLRFDCEDEFVLPIARSPINAHHAIQADTLIDAHQESTLINAHQDDTLIDTHQVSTPINAHHVIQDDTLIDAHQATPPPADATLSTSVVAAASSKPVVFADSTPKGLQSPIPCSVEVQSQSRHLTKFDFELPKKELKVSQKSPFSPPLPLPPSFPKKHALPSSSSSSSSSSLLVSHMRRLSEGAPSSYSSTAALPLAGRQRHASASARLVNSSHKTLRKRQISGETQTSGDKRISLDCEREMTVLQDSPAESEDIKPSSDDEILELLSPTKLVIAVDASSEHTQAAHLPKPFTVTSLADSFPDPHRTATLKDTTIKCTTAEPDPPSPSPTAASPAASCPEDGEIRDDFDEVEAEMEDKALTEAVSDRPPNTGTPLTSFDGLLRQCSEGSKALASQPSAETHMLEAIGYVPTGMPHLMRSPSSRCTLLPCKAQVSSLTSTSPAGKQPRAVIAPRNHKNKKRWNDFSKSEDSRKKQLLPSQAALPRPPVSSSLQHILEAASSSTLPPPVTKRQKVEDDDRRDDAKSPVSFDRATVEEEEAVERQVPPSPHQATSEHSLPGYSLRSRKVDFFESAPRKRRHSVSTSLEQPCNNEEGKSLARKSRRISSPSDGGRFGTSEGVRVVRTDVATGQEEDQTPASSPKCGGNQPGTTAVPPALPPPQPPSKLPVSSDPIKETFDRLQNQNESITDLQMPFNSAVVTLQQPGHHQPLTPSSSSSSSSSSGVSSRPPVAALPPGQLQLTPAMKAPLQLPLWLVTSMANVQLMFEHCKASSFKKKYKNVSPGNPIIRSGSQKPEDYVRLNLSRLTCGTLNLSAVITMFSDPRGCPSANELISGAMQFLMEAYFPKTEYVLALCHKLCDAVAMSAGRKELHLPPLDPSFPPPLLRPEAQMVALFAHLCRMHPKMGNLLPELTSALQQAMLIPDLLLFKMSALARLFTALCRLLGDGDRVLFLCFDLLRRPLAPKEFPVLSGIASVWPAALSRKTVGGKEIFERGKLQPQVLEQQLLSFTLETIVMTISKREGAGINNSVIQNIATLCLWTRGGSVKVLSECLLDLIKTSQQVYIDSTSIHQLPWRRPRPSTVAFHIVHCLRQLSWLQGWVWTNDTLIGAHLWPLLQKWNADPKSIREAAVVCAVRLIGFVCQQEVSRDPSHASSSSVDQLQRVLSALLRPKGEATQASLPIQLAAADSLLELSPPTHSRAPEVVGVVNSWLQAHHGRPSGTVLLPEFNARLQRYLRAAPVQPVN